MDEYLTPFSLSLSLLPPLSLQGISIRGNPHILVVGDPGLGKSQMLQAAANITPRGVYICGNAATSSGLTVTLTKEGSSSEYGLEAGALVLGDQGIGTNV